MRTPHLLLAAVLASAVAGSAWAQSATGGSGASSIPSFDSGSNRGAPAGFESGVRGGYSFQGGGLPSSASGLPALTAPPPSSATGNGPPGPPGRPTAGITGPQ